MDLCRIKAHDIEKLGRAFSIIEDHATYVKTIKTFFKFLLRKFNKSFDNIIGLHAFLMEIFTSANPGSDFIHLCSRNDKGKFSEASYIGHVVIRLKYFMRLVSFHDLAFNRDRALQLSKLQ
jgi:hypothetical protein